VNNWLDFVLGYKKRAEKRTNYATYGCARKSGFSYTSLPNLLTLCAILLVEVH